MRYVHPLYHWPPKSQWQQRRQRARVWRDFDAYVHYPFCRSICDYCGYETRMISRNSSSVLSRQLIEDVLDHRYFDDFSHSRVNSVFFGGGTASLISIETAGDLLRALAADSASEITLECEPGTVSKNKLREFRTLGINRVSVCAQSFNDDELKSISRKHTATDTLRLIEDCIRVGFTNIHIDLMYGLPGQSIQSWEQTLRIALALPIVHLSAYKLFIFKHGLLHRQGHDRPGQETTAQIQRLAEMYLICQSHCSVGGLEQYTLTEFARKGSRCVYLENTFSGRDLLPIGPSAFGRNGLELWENSPYVTSYGDKEARLKEGRELLLDPRSAFKRQAILGLWLLEIDIFSVAHHCGVVPSGTLLDLIKTIDDKGEAEYRNGKLTIPLKNCFFAGNVMDELAALPVRLWTRSNEIDNVLAKSTDELTVASNLEIASIMRVARRDRKLYELLRARPYDTLKSIASDLSADELRQVASQIAAASTANESDDALSDHYKQVWRKVMREHGDEKTDNKD